MINIKATIPRGEARRCYIMEVNGFKFVFEVENTDQGNKEPVQVLYDELRVIIGMIKKDLEITKELPNKEENLTLKDILPPNNQ